MMDMFERGYWSGVVTGLLVYGTVGFVMFILSGCTISRECSSHEDHVSEAEILCEFHGGLDRISLGPGCYAEAVCVNGHIVRLE